MDFTGIARKILSRRARRTDKWTDNGEDVQIRILRRLLRKGSSTEVGRRYGFSDATREKDNRIIFRERVPVVDYEEIRGYVMRMINGESDILWPGMCRSYAQSSGTSGGKSKYIPVTDDSLYHCHYPGASDSVAHYLRYNPGSRLFSGKGLILGGSFANELGVKDNRVHIGDVSATLIDRVNPLVNLFRIPSKEVALMSDWHRKLPALVDAAVDENITNLAGVPSWFLAVIKEVLHKKGVRSLHEVWPNLEVFFHGGISFEPYRTLYESFTDPAKMHFVETYNASEGFFAVNDRPDEKGMLLILDNDVFYEFIPVGLGPESAIGIEGLQKGQEYEIIITSSNGLWRYRLGDTVRIESVSPVRITIAGRTKSFINAFGEELMEDNAERAMAEVCEDLGCAVMNYTAAPLFADNKRRGRHQWWIEWEKRPEDINLFRDRLDAALRRLNSDYDAKRSGGYFLDAPEIVSVPAGTFARWLETVGNHKLGGQRKIPRLCNDRRIVDALPVHNN